MRSAMLLQRLDFESKRQSDVSRSLHSLAAGGLERNPLAVLKKDRPTNFVPRNSIRRQTADVDISCLRREAEKVIVEGYDDRPVLRRKRFTRRQRKSASICPETGLILAAGNRASSSDEDELPKKVSSSPVRLKPTVIPRGLSASTFELSLPENREDGLKKQPRGPAARRAGRRNAKLQSQIHASAHNLDRIEELPLQPEKRSVSVRDLHGEQCDFRNRDSVSKWASQILAELDSLPSSCINLSSQQPSASAAQSSQPKWPAKTATMPPPTAALPGTAPRMTQSSFFPKWEERQTPGDWMTASVSDWKSSAGTWMTPEENHVSDAMSQSMSSVNTETRDREDSIATTLVGSPTDSDAGTPVACSPIPQNEEDPPLQHSSSTSDREKSIKSTTLSSLDRRSIGCQRNDTPLFSFGSNEVSPMSPEPPLRRSSMQLVFKEEGRVELEKVQPPTPAKRTILKKLENREVKMRKHDFMDVSSQKLLQGISRLSKSTVHLAGNDYNSDRLSQSSVPTIRSSLWSCTFDEMDSDSDSLAEWRRKAECRARSNAPPPEAPRQIDRVVASMIKNIENSRLTALDRPESLNLEPKPTDAGTQTSPFSLSRSSSFDWVHDATEGALRDLKTPMSTPRSEIPASSRLESSSETDDADREVAEMTRKGVVVDLEPIPARRPSLQPALPSKEKLFPDLDESIAMLLLYGKEAEQKQPAPVAPPRMTAPKAKLRTVPLQVSNTPPEIRRPVPQYPLSMSESVYDNMAGSQKKIIDSPTSPKPASQVIIEDLLEGKIPFPPSNAVIPFPRKISALGARSGSCELLNDTPKSRLGSSSASLKEAEEEAHECCQWLRRAGFPQYAKQYEEGQFPIDLRSVRSDHEFLEADSLRALFRRIDALNRCVIMRDDNVVLRRRNEDYNYGMYNNYDDEEQVALSNNWKYQRNSHTWSRIGQEQMYGAPVGRVVSTVANYGFRDPYAVKDTRHSPYEDRIPQLRSETRGLERYDLRPEDATSSNSKLQRSQSERIKDTAKALLKKVNPRSGSRRRRESRTRDASTMEISDPRLVSYNTASPESARMFISARPTTLTQEARPRQSRSKSARRQGIVLLSPSSPDSSSADDSIRHRISRERSVPPPRLQTDRPGLDLLPPSSLAYLRRERTPMDDFLYGVGHNSLTRPRNRVAPRPYYDNVYYGTVNSGQPSPAISYSSPYSNHRSYQTPPIRSRQLNIHPDGYYMHGHQFDVSPDASLSRNSRILHMQYNPAPSTSNDVVPQLHVDTIRANNKSQSSLDNTDEEQCSIAAGQNRRDSGVGSSLSRSPSGPSAQRIRQSVLPYFTPLATSLTSSSNSSSSGSWKGQPRRQNAAAPERQMSASVNSCSTAVEETFFQDEELPRTMDAVSTVEMARLRALGFLSITAVMEKYMGSSAIKIGPNNAPASPNSNGKGGNWTKINFLKKLGASKYQDGVKPKDSEDNTVFGQPLEVIYRRTGHCLPRTILEVLRYLRQMAPDTVGIFRKNGVKSRILELRQHCDRDAEADVFVDAFRLDPGQVHDVADCLKQYLRELPDRLMTSRLSEVFASIFLHVPESERTNAVKFALLLLPDENREALQTLLFFLADIAKCSSGNSMNATNISVCFTPSLFHLSASRLDKISSSRRHKTVGAAGMPTEKEMLETKAAQDCLTHMITNCRQIFQVPDGKSGPAVDSEEDLPILKELGTSGPRAYLMDRLSDMLKDSGDRWKSWIVEGNQDGVEISARKSADGHPLRPFRVWVDIAAPPKEVLHRIMKERCVWDTAVLNWRSIDMQLSPDTDLHQFALNDTVGHPTRDCYVVRYHRMDIPELRGACAVVERSVQCGETQLLGGIPAAVLDSRFLIEPKSGYSRVTYISKVDLRGRSSTWYNRVYGSLLARQMARLRDSFKKADDFGPETKV